MALSLRHAIQHGAACGVILSEENSRLIDARDVVKKSRNSGVVGTSACRPRGRWDRSMSIREVPNWQVRSKGINLIVS